MNSRRDNTRVIRSPTGTTLSAKSWLTEAPLRMLMNNLDPGVAERPEELVVYGGIGRAARNWEAYDRIVAWIFVGEQPGRAAFFGAAIIVGAVLISVFGPRFFNSRAAATDLNTVEKPA
jgi:hypothetical protein